jgi:hypothetical protein
VKKRVRVIPEELHRRTGSACAITLIQTGTKKIGGVREKEG